MLPSPSYYNLYQAFHSQPEYRNDVRFLLSASLHRVPYELEEYDFATFLTAVQTLAGEYNLTTYPNRLNENRTFALFGLREFQVYVIDRCSRVSYIIQPPWSLIQYAYVKAAVLSTFYDRPCGKCEVGSGGRVSQWCCLHEGDLLIIYVFASLDPSWRTFSTPR